MSSNGNIAEIGALIGDTARSAMLSALMSGQSISASELAQIANIARSTASEHLNKLVVARLVRVEVRGRYRYFSIGSPLVAQMLETMGAVASVEMPQRSQPKSGKHRKLRLVRTCYDHLAGHIGVEITSSLVSKGHILLTSDGGEVTDLGADMFNKFGIDLSKLSKGRAAIYCRPCLDWTERRMHLAGRVGAAIACRCFELGWLSRVPNSRGLEITPNGWQALVNQFEIKLPPEDW